MQNLKGIFSGKRKRNGSKLTFSQDLNEIKKRRTSKEKSNFFGLDIEELLKQQRQKYPNLNLQVPWMVCELLRVVYKNGRELEGIFRLAGGKAVSNSIKEEIEECEQVDFESCDVHCVGDILKAFLRELPQPLLTFDLWSSLSKKGEKRLAIVYIRQITLFFVHNGDSFDSVEVKQLLERVPLPNLCVMFLITKTLNKMLEFKEKTKMGSENFAVVFTPNLIYPKQSDPLAELQAIPHINKFVSFVIESVDSASLFPSCVTSSLSPVFRSLLNPEKSFCPLVHQTGSKSSLLSKCDSALFSREIHNLRLLSPQKKRNTSKTTDDIDQSTLLSPDLLKSKRSSKAQSLSVTDDQLKSHRKALSPVSDKQLNSPTLRRQAASNKVTKVNIPTKTKSETPTKKQLFTVN